MDLAILIYLIDILAGDPFFSLVHFIPLYCGATVVAFFIWLISDCNDTMLQWLLTTAKNLKPYLVTWTVICILGTVGNKLIPEKETLYAMVAAYGVTELADNERVQKLGGKSLEVLEGFMDTYLEENKKLKQEVVK